MKGARTWNSKLKTQSSKFKAQGEIQGPRGKVAGTARGGLQPPSSPPGSFQKAWLTVRPCEPAGDRPLGAWQLELPLSFAPWAWSFPPSVLYRPPPPP